MSCWRVRPAGSWPAETKGKLLPPLTTLLLPLFWITVEVGEPLRPTRNGALLLLMTPVRLLSGTPPLIGRTWLLGFEKGRLLTSELATIPVTTLPEGRVPPRMSCMKKDNGGCCGATVALVVGIEEDPFGEVVVGVDVTGATSASGGIVEIGAMTGGGPVGRVAEGPTIGVPPLVVPRTWPLADVVEGSVTGTTSGTSSGVSVGGWGSNSSSTRAELAHPRVDGKQQEIEGGLDCSEGEHNRGGHFGKGRGEEKCQILRGFVVYIGEPIEYIYSDSSLIRSGAGSNVC